MTELRRELGVWGAIAIVIGTVIGSGIFRVPQTMVQHVGTPGLVFLVWVVGGVLSLAGALTYAELAAALPGAGGEYVYLNEAYGPVWGFIYGWTQMWVAKSGSIATLATAFFEYFAHFWPALEHVIFRIPGLGDGGSLLEIRNGQLFAMGTIVFLGTVNYLGVRVGGNIQIAVTAVKVLLIGAVIVIGLTAGHTAATSAGISTSPIVSFTWAGFFAALVAALWAYDGWNNVGMVASEIRNPQKNLPLALIGGTIAVILIYLLTNLAYFSVLSPEDIAGHKLVAAEMMNRVQGFFGGGWGASAVSLAAMISIFAALNGSILSGSRIPYAMARDGLFFKPVARVHPYFRTPGVSIMAVSGWSALLVLSGRYDQLFTYVIFASWALYGMSATAVFVLRKRRPDLERPYKTLGYPVVPLLFVVAAVVLEVFTAQNSPRESISGIALILLGLPFYYVWNRRRSS